MKNTLIIFENSLLNLENPKEILEDLSFNLAYKQVSTDPHNAEKLLNRLLIEFLRILKKVNLLDDENATKVIRALIKASIEDAQNSLFALINEAELLNARIQNRKNFIKNQTNSHFLEFEKTLLEFDFKEEFKSPMADAILFDIEMLGILKETAESAFLTTLEKGLDVELTSNEIAKNLVYNAICEADFKKERILKISSMVLDSAFEIANESIIYAKDLCLGVIKGTQEGISRAIEKFRTTLSYAEFEEDINVKSKELIGIEDDFILLLKEKLKKQDSPCKNIVQNLLENELDSFFAKFRRFVTENREQLLLTLNELKKNPKVSDFNKLTQKKIQHFKKEILEFEKTTAEKYREFNSQKAKNLGIRLWEKAKNFVKK